MTTDPTPPASLTGEQIAELREMLEVATPGPWIAKWEGHIETPGRFRIATEIIQRDAALIVAMRNAFPALLAMAEAGSGGDSVEVFIPLGEASHWITAPRVVAEEMASLAENKSQIENLLQTCQKERDEAREKLADMDRLHQEACATVYKERLAKDEAREKLAEQRDKIVTERPGLLMAMEQRDAALLRVKEVEAQCDQTRDYAMTEASKLRAANESLRKALQEMLNQSKAWGISESEVERIAQAALADGQRGEHGKD
jgi:hypothetical protein